jgi:hypothetical protein
MLTPDAGPAAQRIGRQGVVGLGNAGNRLGPGGGGEQVALHDDVARERSSSSAYSPPGSPIVAAEQIIRDLVKLGVDAGPSSARSTFLEENANPVGFRAQKSARPEEAARGYAELRHNPS